jgi:hypothetical protein
LALCDRWQSQAEQRQGRTPDDPVASTLVHCRVALKSLLALWEADRAAKHDRAS